jgi:hypothetical protein
MVCATSINNAAYAQTQTQTQPEKMTPVEPQIPKRYFVHELSAYVSTGISNIGYRFNDGSRSGGVGVGAGFNYTYNVNGSIAIVTGLGFSTYSGKLNLSDYSEDYISVDDHGDEFSLEYTFHEVYRETQSVVLFTIPVMARYSIPLGNGKMKYYASGGFKLGLPLIARATITPGTISTTGYYDYEACTYDNLFEHGFVNAQPGDRTKSAIRLGIAPVLSLETGLRFPLGYTTALTAGVYLDYCPAIRQSGDKHILEFQSLTPAQFAYNSALNTDMVKKITLFSSGVKIGISF